MKTVRNLVGVGLIGVTLFGAAFVYGQPGFGWGGHHFGHGGRGGPFPWLKGLDLTDEQETRIAAIKSAHWETFHALRTQSMVVREEIAARLSSPEQIIPEDLKPQVERLAALHNELLAEHFKVALEMRNVLTADQRAKAAERRQKLKALRTEMRELLRGNE